MKKGELDMILKKTHNLKTRTRQAFEAQNVQETNKTFDLLDFSQSFFLKNVDHSPILS